ncbi:MAG: CBS domain-containing protein [Methanomassiliicoccaceae archaeon]|jgi:predicted transcriptional regulator|nr:CBS domain-containing protein [Euryarchaeota archaeon]HOB38834.1 CBS domain-containing protein [Methanomassiliicoccaceae archaeon]HQA21424.1 CBS domain-containing protein [Methanomassiliicoccaceae archaeon]
MDLSDIRRLRIKVGLSQTALAKKASVSQAHIAKIESGKVDPRFSTVERIFKCLKEEEKDHCRKYMTPFIHGVQHDDSVSMAARIMREKEVSQVVVFRDRSVIGMITEEDVLRFPGDLTSNADKAMSEPPPMVSGNTSADTVKDLLLEFPAVIVMEQDHAIGIITRSDLIKR